MARYAVAFLHLSIAIVMVAVHSYSLDSAKCQTSDAFLSRWVRAASPSSTGTVTILHSGANGSAHAATSFLIWLGRMVSEFSILTDANAKELCRCNVNALVSA
jgi:hypothetical protein